MLSLEVATPERKVNSLDAVIHTQESPRLKAVLSRMQLTLRATRPNTSRRFALGASSVCLVGENPTFSVPAL